MTETEQTQTRPFHRGRHVEGSFERIDRETKSIQASVARAHIGEHTRAEIDDARARLTAYVSVRGILHALKLIDGATIDHALEACDHAPALTDEQTELILRLCGIRLTADARETMKTRPRPRPRARAKTSNRK